jgi:thermitase
MLRRLVITAALAALLAGALLGTSPAASPSEYDPNTLIVNFSDSGRAHPLIQALGDLLGGQLRDGSAVVQLRGGRSVEQALALYRVLPGVRFAEPNFLAHADIAAPNDPSFGSQWALSSTKINAVAGWSIYPNSYASSGGPTIAILDTGVQANHPDLNGKVLTGANCLSGSCGSGNSADDNGHGTHVGGTAAALTNNSTGIAGVAPNARILPVKVLDSNGSGSYAAIAAGINWAVGQGARVINMSLSGSSFSSALCNAVSNAVAAGVVVVAAAGNSGSSAARYPAA